MHFHFDEMRVNVGTVVAIPAKLAGLVVAGHHRQCCSDMRAADLPAGLHGKIGGARPWRGEREARIGDGVDQVARILRRIRRFAAEGDVFDLDAGLLALKQQPEKHIHHAVVELHVQHDGRLAGPIEADVAGIREGHRSGLEIHFRGSVHQTADIAELSGADECNEVQRVDQPKLGRDFLQGKSKRHFALVMILATLLQHL